MEAGALYGALALLLLPQLYAIRCVAAYPGRAARTDAWEQELARHPRDPWLWSQAGTRQREAGRLDERRRLSPGMALTSNPALEWTMSGSG